MKQNQNSFHGLPVPAQFDAYHLCYLHLHYVFMTMTSLINPILVASTHFFGTLSFSCDKNLCFYSYVQNAFP